MKGLIVDANVILDIFLNDPDWSDWSENVLTDYSREYTLYINSIIYTEISVGFERIEDLDTAIYTGDFKMLEIPKEALFLAGKVYLEYKKNKGTKRSPLPDFYIGAQAAVLGLDLITRDVNRYQKYFPKINLITPMQRP